MHYPRQVAGECPPRKIVHSLYRSHEHDHQGIGSQIVRYQLHQALHHSLVQLGLPTEPGICRNEFRLPATKAEL